MDNAGLSVFIDSLISDFVSPEFYRPSLTATQPRADLAVQLAGLVEFDLQPVDFGGKAGFVGRTSDMAAGFGEIS